MTELDYIQALILGLVQGVTEFLPVSSSGHLAICQQLMGLDADSHAMLVFDVAAHLGTLVAVAWVFAPTFTRYWGRLASESRRGFTGRRVAWRIAGLGVAASLPTAVVGLMFKDTLEAAFDKPLWIGIALLTTGMLLFVVGYAPRPRRGWRRFGFDRAFGVGLAQGAAILPGISRSGATICVAMLLGLRRQWAAEFSFFIAVPAICGAALLKIRDTFAISADEMSAIGIGPILLGSVVALLSGYVALRLLLAAVKRAKLQYFCFYCWALGLLVLAGHWYA